jgi:hypothetical protein
MKRSDIYGLNLGILGAVFAAMLLGAGFHQSNMSRKYWTMFNAGCINTNALVNLEQKTGNVGLSQNHMTEVPRWIANINSTMRLGVLAIIIGFSVNMILMFKAKKEEKKTEQGH